jgi:flagellar biosynthesis protein FlhF
VQVIAADMTSAGAFAQISELCRPMGVRPQPWSPSTPLDTAKDLIVIDGPGINPFDDTERASIEEIIAATGAEPVLVMAAGNNANEAADVTAAFLALGARRLIATRIDAARRLGCILAAAEAGLALAEAGVGRMLAETLLAMSPLALARLLISAAPQPVGTSDRGKREKAA